MGTNYYFYEKPACECCGRPYEAQHIGKSSAGWCFSLHIFPEDAICDLEDWKKKFAIPNSRIEDEYGRRLSVEKMLDVITDRSWPGKLTRTLKFYIENGAEPGPNGLLRHRVDGWFCIGRGEGTWDYLIGNFS